MARGKPNDCESKSKSFLDSANMWSLKTFVRAVATQPCEQNLVKKSLTNHGTLHQKLMKYCMVTNIKKKNTALVL